MFEGESERCRAATYLSERATKILSLTEPIFWNPVKNCARSSKIGPVPKLENAWAAAGSMASNTTGGGRSFYLSK